MEELFDDLTGYVDDHDWAESAVVVLIVLAAAMLAFFIVRTILIPVVHRAARNSAFHWDDIVLDRPVLNAISFFAPLLAISIGIGFVPHWSEDTVDIARRVSNALFIVAAILVINATLASVNRLYNTLPISRDRPINAYIQLAKIFIVVLGIAFAIAVLARQSPWFFISGLGAMTAVLLLIFRDTILSFVASIQLAQNDMIRIGDWIEVPGKGADGEIIDIALHTVKIQNFDNTIVTVPTHTLITDSFRNWRGMVESGGRRIMRSINIDAATIRFLEKGEIDELRRFVPLRDYLDGKLDEIGNEPEPQDGAVPDRRRLTNIGTFRAYVFRLLQDHPRIESERFTLLVRQLAAGPTGVPIEVYAFTDTTAWAAYEDIQADIFDHLLAITPAFGLRVFQQPSGADLSRVAGDGAGERPAVDLVFPSYGPS